MPLVIAAMIWKTMYNPAGPINALLGREIPWLTNQATVLPAIIIMSVWKGVGYYLMLFLAGLSNIPVELYETAFRFSRMGRAAAESVFLFLLLMGFSIIQLRLGRSANK